MKPINPYTLPLTELYQRIRDGRVRDSYLKKMSLWFIVLVLVVLIKMMTAHAAVAPYKITVLGTTAVDISHKFPATMERNLTAARVKIVLPKLRNNELQDLATYYKKETGGNIYRLDTVIKANGTATDKNRWALALQGKLGAAPCPGCGGGAKVAAFASPAPTVDFTFKEIYLEFRTAPVGSLSIRAALFETANFIATRTSLAYGVGYATGSAVASVLERYAPDYMVALGSAFSFQQVMDTLSFSPNAYEQGYNTADLNNYLGSPTLYSNPGDYYGLGAQAAIVGGNCSWCSQSLDEFFANSIPDGET